MFGKNKSTSNSLIFEIHPENSRGIFLKLFLILFVFISCKNAEKETTGNPAKTEFQEITNENYELSKPPENIKKVLILFGGFPEKPEDIKREFKILEMAREKNIAVLFMNYNQKLWLEENEKHQLAELLQKIFIENKLPTNDTYIGGFSSGGNVALLIASFLTEKKGYRANGDRHPHSWSIVDKKELIKWMLE